MEADLEKLDPESIFGSFASVNASIGVRSLEHSQPFTTRTLTEMLDITETIEITEK